jgi:hypothetical protein
MVANQNVKIKLVRILQVVLIAVRVLMVAQKSAVAYVLRPIGKKRSANQMVTRVDYSLERMTRLLKTLHYLGAWMHVLGFLCVNQLILLMRFLNVIYLSQ